MVRILRNRKRAIKSIRTISVSDGWYYWLQVWRSNFDKRFLDHHGLLLERQFLPLKLTVVVHLQEVLWVDSLSLSCLLCFATQRYDYYTSVTKRKFIAYCTLLRIKINLSVRIALVVRSVPVNSGSLCV